MSLSAPSHETFPETFTTSDWCCIQISRKQMLMKRRESSQQTNNPLEEECAEGSVLDLTSHLFLLLSSSGRRNFKWCLYLYSFGSGEQLWVLMWVKNVPRCKSFHIPSRGRNNWSMSHRCDVLWSGKWCFVGVSLAWNTVFGHLYHELFGAHFIQSSFELNRSNIVLVLCHEKSCFLLKKDTKETVQTANLLSLSHARLVRLLNWTDVQISLFSWKYGFLIHRYLGLNQFHQSWSLSGRLDWKQGRIPTPPAAAGYPVLILTWYNLLAWSSPEALLLLLNWACISLHGLTKTTFHLITHTNCEEATLHFDQGEMFVSEQEEPSGHTNKISRGLLDV